MAKETSVDFPPGGQVSLWAYDSVNDKWYAVLADASGHLQIDVLASALPTGAATAGNQTTMITSLQLIDDLQNALNSVATDELDVVLDGQNADVEITQTTPADLVVGNHGYNGSAWKKQNLALGLVDRWKEGLGWTMTAAAEENSCTAVPEGYIYFLTLMSVQNRTNPGSDHIFRIDFNTSPTLFIKWVTGVAQWIPTVWEGYVALGEGDVVTVRVTNGNVGDVLWAGLSGYKMKIDM